MSSNTDTDRLATGLSAEPDDYPSDEVLEGAKHDVLEYFDGRDFYVLLPEVWEYCDADARTVTAAIEELQSDGVLEMMSAVRPVSGGEAHAGDD